MDYTTIKRSGGWCIELINPLHHNGQVITEIHLQPPTVEQIVRWDEYLVPSTFAFLEEISRVPETALRQLSTGDTSDYARVFRAFIEIIPAHMRKTVAEGKRPLVTPADEMANRQPVFNAPPGAQQAPPEQTGLFPVAKEASKVEIFPAHQTRVQETKPESGTGFAAAPPDIMQRVG